MRTLIGALLIIAVFSRTSILRAENVSGLYNTGVDSSGTVLPDGTAGDPHYDLVGVPDGTPAIVVKPETSYPLAPYVGHSAISAWIGPDNGSSDPIGIYDYQTTFFVADPTTASLSGSWTTDDPGLTILLNSQPTGVTATDPSQYNLGFAPFSITSGFVAGVNTLDFLVNNGGGPTSLRVEMDGAVSSAVPEPSSLGLLGLGGIGLAATAYRRRKVA